MHLSAPTTRYRESVALPQLFAPRAPVHGQSLLHQTVEKLGYLEVRQAGFLGVEAFLELQQIVRVLFNANTLHLVSGHTSAYAENRI